MNLSEAAKKGIKRVRLELWANPNAYLRITITENGYFGPVAHLFDDDVQKNVLKIEPGSQKVMTFGLGDEWVEFSGIISPYDKEP